MKFTAYDRSRLFERSGGRCEICCKEADPDGRRLSLQLIVPRSKGGKKSKGEDSYGNVRVICEQCNEPRKPRNIAARITQSEYEMITRWKLVNMRPGATTSDLIKEALFRMCEDQYEDERIQAEYYAREEWIKFQAIKRMIEEPITEMDMDYTFDIGIGYGNNVRLELKHVGKTADSSSDV